MTGRPVASSAWNRSPAIERNGGDLDPANKKLTGHYGDKHPGSIDERDSMITEENGFKNIEILGPGVSPEGRIEQILKGEK